MAYLRTKGRQNTPRAKVLQQQIVDFKRMVELRGLMTERRTCNRIAKLRSEFDRLLRPHAETLGITVVVPLGRTRPTSDNPIINAMFTAALAALCETLIGRLYDKSGFRNHG